MITKFGSIDIRFKFIIIFLGPFFRIFETVVTAVMAMMMTVGTCSGHRKTEGRKAEYFTHLIYTFHNLGDDRLRADARSAISGQPRARTTCWSSPIS